MGQMIFYSAFEDVGQAVLSHELVAQFSYYATKWIVVPDFS